jgi:aminopeptidase N
MVDAGIPDAAASDSGADGAPSDSSADGAASDSGADAAPSDSGADAAPSDSGADAAMDAPVTVARYDYRFDLDSGEARTHLSFAGFGAAHACVRLQSRLSLRNPASVGLANAQIEQQDERVSLCGSARAGEVASLTANVTVREEADPGTGVGFSRKLDAYGNRFTYLLSWFEGCDRFGPCDRAPDRLSEFVFDVSHPTAETVLCPGARSASSGRTRCALVDTRAPTYSSFAIAANAAWQRELLVKAAGVSVFVYEVPGGRVRGALDGSAVAEFLTWITERLGPFPYGDELRVATAPVKWLGMEHPANIVLREDLLDIPQSYTNVALHALLHEIAHQWAGNRTTLADPLDFVWKEAISEYLVYTFEQQLRPASESLATRTLWHSIGVGAPYPVRPLTTPDVSLSTWTSGGYGSGPMTLFVQLEPWFGQSALLAAIARFLEADVRSMSDLRAALEAETRADLGPYFRAWVFGVDSPEWPVFKVETSALRNGTEVRIVQEHASKLPFPCVLDLDLVGTTRSQRVRADFGLARPSSTLVLETSFDEPITRVAIDPEKRLLDLSLPSGDLAPSDLRWHP